MIEKEQSLNILVVYVSMHRLHLTSTNPTSVIIPQAIAMENYSFTALSRDVKNLEMETFSHHNANIP